MAQRKTRLVQPSGERPAEPARVRKIHPWVTAKSLELAGGDKRRLVFCDDGGIIVVNQPNGQVPGDADTQARLLGRASGPKKKDSGQEAQGQEVGLHGAPRRLSPLPRCP